MILRAAHRVRMSGVGARRVECISRSISPSDGLEVVRIALDGYGDAMDLAPLLDDVERARAVRFVQARDRRRFIAAHAITRAVLGGCLGVPPETVRFRTDPGGKPAVASPDANLEFSLSHSGERAILAVTRGRAVGVDIEHIRPIEALQISRRFFSRADHAALASVDQGDLLTAFFRCWTRKEAFVKARGTGLSFPLAGFDVSIQEKVSNALLRCECDPGAAARWTILPLSIDEGYVAAVALEGSKCRVTCWDAPP